MKLLVTAKIVADPEAEPKVLFGKRSLKGTRRMVDVIDDTNVQAIRESLPEAEVTVINIGCLSNREPLAKLIALGSNEVIQMCGSEKLIASLDCLAKAKLLKDFVLSNSYNLVILGCQSSDTTSAQVGPALAGLLNWPCITGVKLIKQLPNKNVIANCSFEDINVDINVPSKCILTCDLSVKTPKLVTVVDLIKAKRKPINVNQISEVNFELRQQLTVVEEIISNTPRLSRVFTHFANA